MAACTNNGGSIAKRAVTAALVGVLSVGTVPMAALAAGMDGISTMVADESVSFANSSVTISGLNSDAGDVPYVVASEDGADLTVTQIKTGNNETYDLTKGEVARQFVIDIVKVGTDGQPTNEVVTEKAATTTPGTYAVRIKAIGFEFDGAYCYQQFVVKPETLVAENLSVYEVNPANPTSTADTQFVYTGSELNLGIEYDGAALVEGKDYTVKFIGDTTGTGNEGVEVKDAGNYHAVITGLGIYAGQNEIAIPGTIEVTPFDLADSNVTISCDPVIDSNVFPGHPTSVVYFNSSNSTYTYLDPSLVDLKITSGGTDDAVFDEIGQYEVECTPAEAAGSNVICSSTASTTIDKYAGEASVEYNDAAFPENFKTDLSDKRPTYFDVWGIKAYDEDDNQLSQNEVSVYVYDESGQPVYSFINGTHQKDHTWKQKAGTYTVKVVAADDDHSVAAVKTCTVTVINGTVDADATAYVNYDVDGKGDWEAVTSIETTYTEAGLTVGSSTSGSNAQIVVKDEDGNELTYGTDYAVRVTDAEGKELSADASGKFTISDAGSYTIEIVGKTYEISGSTTVPVTVKKASFQNVASLSQTNFTAEKSNYSYLAWREGGSVASDFVSDDVLNLYDVTILKDGTKVDKVTDEGVYELNFKPLSDEIAANYETPETLKFTCVKDGTDGSLSHVLFTDVEYSDYYADSVARVREAGYLFGYNGTDLFGSEDSLKRGDVACILYNMAKANKFTGNDEGSFVEGQGYVSFDDVDGYKYYAQAIAWAKSAGIVNGYNGSFRPEDTVTREEFTAMVANYASKFDPTFEAVDTEAVLATMPDGSMVSDWAKDVVAWGVENDVIGNGGSIMPTSTIIRADAACIVSNYMFGL